MRVPLFGVGLLLSLDSFALCFAVGTLPQRPHNQYRLAMMFALCDGLASWIGSMGLLGAGSTLTELEWLAPAGIAAYGLYVLALAWRMRMPQMAKNVGGLWVLLGLPLCLSVDNLVTVVGSNMSGMPSLLAAGVLGMTSGCLALSGWAFGAMLARKASIRTRSVCGYLLMTVAITLYYFEASP